MRTTRHPSTSQRLRRTPIVGDILRRFDTAVRWRADEQTAPLRRELDDLRPFLDETRSFAVRAISEVERLAPHVAALDARIEDLRAELTPLSGDSDDLAAARSILDEMRKEHAAVRVRMSMLATYSERLERLEGRASS